MKRMLKGALIAAALIAAGGAALADGWSNVVINGQRLTVAQLYALQMQIGTAIAPGTYALNAQGCWLHYESGQTGCLGAGPNGGARGNVYSRDGGGARGGGQWNHWSDAAGGAVGGDSNGCVYTSFGWSNC